MNRVKILISFFVLLPFYVFSQTLIHVNGIIINSKQQPIPFASIGYYNNQIGSITDSNGLFTIKKIIGDSIKISSIGYKSVTVYVVSNTSKLNIVLDEDYSTLNTVSVKSRRKTTAQILLGHYKSKDNYLVVVGKQIQIATFIPNESKIRGYIDEIKFKLSEFRKTTYLLRIRIYNKNIKTQLPFEDLLIDDNILSGKQLKHNNTFSLKDKSIELPEDGVFVSFEWIPQIGVTNENDDPPILLGNLNADKNYVYKNYKEIRWFPSNSKSLSSAGYRVPNISLTIGY